jgi:steroid delta-isomerase-like uncharacterized protein
VSIKENKALVHRLFEEWNKGKEALMAVMDKLCAPDVVYHSGGDHEIRGLKDFKKFMSEFYSAFPDNHVTLDDVVVERNKVAIRYTWTGTNKGEIGGIPPTNKKVKASVIQIDHIVNGKFMEGWERSDTLGLMQQLGALPTSKKEK